MLLDAWATTSPASASAKFSHATSRPSAVMASNPPIRPEVSVMEKTAARVISSHFEMTSMAAPVGKLAVASTERQFRKR